MKVNNRNEIQLSSSHQEEDFFTFSPSFMHKMLLLLASSSGLMTLPSRRSKIRGKKTILSKTGRNSLD